MKKLIKSSALAAVCLLMTGCGGKENAPRVWPVILAVLAVLLLALAGLRTYSHIQYLRRQARKNSRRRVRRQLDVATVVLYALAALLLLTALLGGCNGPREEVEATQPETSEPAPTQPPVVFAPQALSDTDPENWQIRWEIFQGDQLVADYTREDAICFDAPEDYFALPGISTFRGNHYRNSTTYGTATVTEQSLSLAWSSQTGALEGSSWTGSGWTGQPLMVRWDGATRQIMNLYREKQAKEDLVEVIYATLDGHIYFLDLDDGSYTRDPIYIGMCFKGSGSLDPRGYPLLYVGSGDADCNGRQPRMFIISLIDGTILYEYGNDDPLALRHDNENWCAFDSAPLVDGQTDTLIWPGENGLLYTVCLNTDYDKSAGTIRVSPDAPVLTRYTTARSGEEAYWYGYEASANIAENYLYISENGGMFYCVDLNTMELLWAQDTLDDSNCTPVLERVAEDEAYLYTAPSLHWTKDENSQGTVSLYKLDALTGAIIWQTPYDVHTVEGVSGGVQSSPLLGREDSSLAGLIFFTISRTPTVDAGLLVALDTQTGREVWRMDMTHYAWSSPVAVYGEDGTGYVVVCDSNGDAYLLDGASGQVLDSVYLGGLVEATPAVFEDMLVVGTRMRQICGIHIS